MGRKSKKVILTPEQIEEKRLWDEEIRVSNEAHELAIAFANKILKDHEFHYHHKSSCVESGIVEKLCYGLINAKATLNSSMNSVLKNIEYAKLRLKGEDNGRLIQSPIHNEAMPITENSVKFNCIFECLVDVKQAEFLKELQETEAPKT